MVHHHGAIGPLEVKMKKKTLLLGAVLLVVLALEGCATISGMEEGGRYTEPRESLEKGQSPDRTRL
jgi:hypothetical protein